MILELNSSSLKPWFCKFLAIFIFIPYALLGPSFGMIFVETGKIV